MNKHELIKRISKRCNIKQYQAEEYLDALTEILTETLLEGGRIKLTEYGTFVGFLGIDHPPKTSPKWCPKRNIRQTYTD